jgi:hypothetical protein
VERVFEYALHNKLTPFEFRVLAIESTDFIGVPVTRIVATEGGDAFFMFTVTLDPELRTGGGCTDPIPVQVGETYVAAPTVRGGELWLERADQLSPTTLLNAGNCTPGGMP